MKKREIKDNNILLLFNKIDFLSKKIFDIENKIQEYESNIKNDITYSEFRITNNIKHELLEDGALLELIVNEKARIAYAFGKCQNYKNAAKLLGISERTMYRKVKKYKLDRKSNKALN